MKKNAFYFILGPILVFKIFKLFCDVFITWENSLIRKLRLISEIMASKPWKQIITINIFYDMSRSKGNQAMKFGQ